MFEGSRKKEKIKKEIRNEREKIARIGRTSRRRSRIIVLYVVVAGTTTYQRVGCRRNRAVADEATSTLALRYHDLDFSAPRVSIAPCLHFVHALFRPDYNTPRLAASLSLQIYIYIYIFISQPFFRPAYKGRSDERVCNAVTRPCYRLANSSPPETRLSPAARNFSIFLTNVDYVSSSSFLFFLQRIYYANCAQTFLQKSRLFEKL